MHLLCALGVYTGMRKNELANARWSWIDFKGRGRILIQNEGRFQTKSGKPRKISMSSRLRAILERYDEDGDRYILAPDNSPKKSTTQYRTDFTWAFDTVKEAAGVDWITPHKLRHTFASQHAIAGVSLYKIGTWLGHADMKATQIYAHLSPDDDDIDSF